MPAVSQIGESNNSPLRALEYRQLPDGRLTNIPDTAKVIIVQAMGGNAWIRFDGNGLAAENAGQCIIENDTVQFGGYLPSISVLAPAGVTLHATFFTHS